MFSEKLGKVIGILEALAEYTRMEAIIDIILADAIKDRLTAGAHRIELKGESMRRKKINNSPSG